MVFAGNESSFPLRNDRTWVKIEIFSNSKRVHNLPPSLSSTLFLFPCSLSFSLSHLWRLFNLYCILTYLQMSSPGQCVQWSQQRVGEAPRILLGESASVGFALRVTCVVAHFVWSSTTATDATVRFGCNDPVQEERICQRRVEILSSTKRWAIYQHCLYLWNCLT